MAEMLIQSESLTAIADKIRILSDTEDAMSLDAMESHISEANVDIDTEADLITQIAAALEGKAAGSGGEDANMLGDLIMGTISSCTNSKATFIRNSAFLSFQNLTTVDFPAVTSIGASAFYNCSNLTTISFPAATTIRDYAFYDCSKLTSISFPVATSIGGGAFYGCDNLITVNFPAVTSIGASAFSYCKGLTTASFPAVTYIGRSAFNYCYNLKSLYLIGSSLCSLPYSDIFISTPIGGYSTSAKTYGSIYVPASLLTSYQTATNWTYYSSRFVGI